MSGTWRCFPGALRGRKDVRHVKFTETLKGAEIEVGACAEGFMVAGRAKA